MKEIEFIPVLEELIAEQSQWRKIAIQGLDLTPYTKQLQALDIQDCIFLGCDMERALYLHLIHHENALFPELNVPFKIYRSILYTKEDLYDHYDPDNVKSYELSTDYKIYKHFIENGKGEPNTIHESLVRRLHDHAITDALDDFLERWGGGSEKIIAIMGGHSLSRNDENYRKAALIAKALSEQDFMMIPGGDPGAMDATHLGAWLAYRSTEDSAEGIAMLSEAPLYNDEKWLSQAFKVMERFELGPSNVESIGIPTWLYGHEPPTPFATRIAKYFANCVREEGLLALAKGGVIYAPGSAGTIQEIFQDAAQNHYKSYEIASPMVFLNTDYWTNTKPVYPILKQLAKGHEYDDWLSIHDEVAEVIAAIHTFQNKGIT